MILQLSWKLCQARHFNIFRSFKSIWAWTQQNLSSGFLTKQDSNQSPQLQRLARKLIILLVASLDMILSDKQIIKALIRLHRSAGWSVPLLFANTEDKFSCIEVHIKVHISKAVYHMMSRLGIMQHHVLKLINHYFAFLFNCTPVGRTSDYDGSDLKTYQLMRW